MIILSYYITRTRECKRNDPIFCQIFLLCGSLPRTDFPSLPKGKTSPPKSADKAVRAICCRGASSADGMKKEGLRCKPSFVPIIR